MVDTYIKLLNLKDNIMVSMPKIKKAFIAFYGEDQKDFINEKLDKICLIEYGLMDSLNTIIYNIQNGISEELISQFIEPFDDKDKAKKMFFSNISLEYFNIMPFSYYIEYRKDLPNGKNDYTKKNALEFLKQLNSLVTEDNMDYLISSNAFSEIDKLIPRFEKMVGEYKERIKKIQTFVQMNNTIKSKKNDLRIKFYHKLIDEFANLFPNEMVNEVKNDIFFYKDNMLTAYLGKSIIDTSYLEAFSEESYEIVKDGGWRATSIINDRIKFFKALGVDLGNNYDDYANSKEIQNLIPNSDLIKRIQETRKRLDNEMHMEYYKESMEYQRNKKMIDSIPFLIRNGIYDTSFYNKNYTCVIPNLIEENELFKCFPLVLINVSLLDGYYDSHIVHEINHVMELDISNVSQEEVNFRCGWDNCSSKLLSEEKNDDDDEKRKYELFNEIINELIAQEITWLMHSNGDYIINNPADAKIKGGTSYEHTLFLVKDFYNEYKEEIIASRRNGNIDIIFDKVGKDNFDELNSLFSIFNEHFSGFNYYHLIDSLRLGEETEDTLLFQELKNKRDAILEKMREFSKKKS